MRHPANQIDHGPRPAAAAERPRWPHNCLDPKRQEPPPGEDEQWVCDSALLLASYVDQFADDHTGGAMERGERRRRLRERVIEELQERAIEAGTD